MNITLSVDEQVAQRAREAAQKMGKSLNQVVREYLEQLGGGARRAQQLGIPIVVNPSSHCQPSF